MARSNKSNDFRVEDLSDNKFEQFLMQICKEINENIHYAYNSSVDWLDKHEIDAYIDEEKGLNLRAVRENEELTVRDVLEIGINFARWEMHTKWHNIMDDTAEEFNVPPMPDLDGHMGKEGGIKVITDPTDLPEEVQQALKDVLDKIAKKKKGKK